MTLSNAISDLQDKALALGVKAAPKTIPEGMSVFPFAVSYPRTGSGQVASAGFGHQFHTIWTEIHFNRTLLGAAIDEAMPYIESLFSAIIGDPTLSSTVSSVTAVRYTFGRLEWAGEQTIGVRFEVDVKVSVTG
jgi:hypothetical protein